MSTPLTNSPPGLVARWGFEDDASVVQDSGPRAGLTTSNLTGTDVGPISVAVDVTSLGQVANFGGVPGRQAVALAPALA